MSTPEWLVAEEPTLCPLTASGVRRKIGSVEKTLNSTASLAHRALAESNAPTGVGPLRRVDPRVKVISLLGMLLVAAMVRNIGPLLAMFVGAAILAVWSSLPISWLLRRLVIPMLTGLTVLPATMNWVTPGNIVLPLGSAFGHTLGVTSQGLRGAATIVLRVAVSIGLGGLLTATTRWQDILRALRSFRAPKIFVLTLALAYRYIFHLAASVNDMYLARTARTVGAGNGMKRDSTVKRDSADGNFAARSAGALFAKSYALSEEVHQAMLARGYTGEPQYLSESDNRKAELSSSLAFIAAAVLTATLLLGWDHRLGT